MNEREWQKRFETTVYDDDDDELWEDTEPEPSVPELVWDENGRIRRLTRQAPIVYYVRRATPPRPGGG
jgi:hypothetical protein